MAPATDFCKSRKSLSKRNSTLYRGAAVEKLIDLLVDPKMSVSTELKIHELVAIGVHVHLEASGRRDAYLTAQRKDTLETAELRAIQRRWLNTIGREK